MCHTSFTQFKRIVNEYDITEIRQRHFIIWGFIIICVLTLASQLSHGHLDLWS